MKVTQGRGCIANFEQTRPARQRFWRKTASAFAVLCLASLSGCFHSAPQKLAKPSPPVSGPEPHLPLERPEPSKAVQSTPVPEPTVERNSPPVIEPVDLWGRIRSRYQLTEMQHPRIRNEIRRLQSSPAAFNALIQRSEPFLHHIVERVEQRKIPAEIALLPAVESGFRPYAYSPDGAAGLWQFMPATGRGLGLKQDWWYDGRRDVLAATDAALDYLERLNKRFDGDWLHALAAYNAGGGRVSRALRKARRNNASTAFWDLDLPRETDHYVPRLLALAKIIADPGRYGLALPSLEDRAYFEPIPTDGQIDLKVAAELAEIPVEDLLLLNPGFNRWSTRPQGPHHLLLPKPKAQAFRTALAKLPDEKRLRWKHHRIVKGDNLGKIARNYSVSVKAIQQANGLDGDLIRLGKSLVIPLSESVALAGPARNLGLKRALVRYRVRKGDSLYKIARKFRVKIADLRRWNTVGRYIKPGQRLTVFVDPSRQTL